MPPQRFRFDILTDTGGDFQQLSGITGGFMFQVQFSPDTGAPLDTGARLKLEALNQDGSAFTVADFEHVGSGGSLAKWTRALSADVMLKTLKVLTEGQIKFQDVVTA